MRPLDPTWWCRDRSGEFYSQQNDSARLVRDRTTRGTTTGRKTTGWLLYVDGVFRARWRCSFADAKRFAFEMTSGATP